MLPELKAYREHCFFFSLPTHYNLMFNSTLKDEWMTSEQGSRDISNHDIDEALKEQVAHDLSQKIDQFKSPSKGLKQLGQMMGIHDKTLKRLIDKQNRPNYQTLLKIYRCLLKTQKDNVVWEKAPKIVQEFFKKSAFHPPTSQIDYEMDVEKEIVKNPVFAEIYFLCGTGGITREYIRFQFGQMGDDIFEKMIEEDIICPKDHHKFELGNKRATLSPETIKHLAIHFMETFAKPELNDQSGANFLALYAQGVNQETYNSWIKIDEEATRKKIELAQNPDNQGDIQAFTVLTTETFRRPRNKGH